MVDIAHVLLLNISWKTLCTTSSSKSYVYIGHVLYLNILWLTFCTFSISRSYAGHCARSVAQILIVTIAHVH
uniref:Uncharacterized protein n=1 Tax=Panstrongylus lignarius TaxID=156445 RepID=A0A224Y671_9HEMI